MRKLSDAEVAASVKAGGEPDAERAKYFMQAIPTTLARLGFVVFQYDMVGYADSTAIKHTEGFRDTLEIGRLKRQVAGLTDLQLGDYVNRGRWAPVVPRHLVLEVSERIDRDGEIVVPLDEASVRSTLDQLEAAEVEAIAICTLWSVANPVHERRIDRKSTRLNSSHPQQSRMPSSA